MLGFSRARSTAGESLRDIGLEQAKGFEPSTPTQQLPAPERSQLGAIIRLRPCLRSAFDACCRATSKNGPSGAPMVPPARHFAKGGAKGEARGRGVERAPLAVAATRDPQRRMIIWAWPERPTILAIALTDREV